MALHVDAPCRPFVLVSAVGFECDGGGPGRGVKLRPVSGAEDHRPVIHLVVHGEDFRMAVHQDGQVADRHPAQEVPAGIRIQDFHCG